jgi:(p)ppGpp synthase/HD superfamily hydrolase
VVENTETEVSELEERFGPEVTSLVEVLSDDPAIADEEARRAEVRERVREADGDAVPIYGADKVSKARELRAMIAAGAEEAQVESKRSHYWRCLAMLEETIPESRIAELLRFELEALEILPPERPRGS